MYLIILTKVNRNHFEFQHVVGKGGFGKVKFLTLFLYIIIMIKRSFDISK